MTRVAAVLAVYFGLSWAFASATPPLEASDEARHFGYVLHVAERHALPVASLEAPGRARQEATQAPLYYVIAAAALLGRVPRDADAFYAPRPGSPIGRADIPGPRDQFLRPPPSPGSPTRGAIARLRALSMLCGAGVVVLAFALARGLGASPDAAALAALLVGWNPMFLFVANAVSNDALVALLVTAVAAHACRQDFDAGRASHLATAGALAGLATLAKASGAIALGLVLWRVARGPLTPRRAFRSAAVAAFAFALPVLPWLTRNAALYGDPLGTRVHATLAGNLRPQLQPLALLFEWDGFVKSLWGVFGAFNVIYPDAVYVAFYALTALAAVAACRAALNRRRDPRVGALCVLFLLNVAGVAAWTSRLLGSQGRLLFPSIAAGSALAALGLGDAGRRTFVLAGAGATLLLVTSALYACLVLLPAAYAAP
jgi:4-amino-4-deoxy-L-arabinose transferase-like glycosyltransferase